MAILDTILSIQDNFTNKLNKFANGIQFGTSKAEKMQERLSKTQELMESFSSGVDIGSSVEHIANEMNRLESIHAPEVEMHIKSNAETVSNDMNRLKSFIDRLTGNTAQISINADFEAAASKLAQMESTLDALSDKYRFQERVISDLNQSYASALGMWGNGHVKVAAIEKKLIDAKLAQAKLNVAVDNANDSYLKQYDLVERLKNPIDEATRHQEEFNNRLQHGEKMANNLLGGIKKFIGAYLSIAAVKQTVGSVGEWLGLADMRINSEKQLAVVMQNMGAVRDEYESIKQAAAQLQNTTPYSSDLYIAGAGELATYLESGSAIETMMGTLADYAAGMGGIKVDRKAMVEYATQLGKALDGKFDGLSEKGFVPTEAEKKILKYGDELQRVAVIQGIIARNWDGLAAAMANTPQGQLAQMKNTWDEIKESVGSYLYPDVLKLFTTLNTNMPTAKAVMFGFASAIAVVISGLSTVVDVGSSAASFIIDNWSFVSPVLWGVAAALAAYNVQIIIAAAKTGIATAAKLAHAAASAIETMQILRLILAQEGLNAALYACPLSWILMGIVALIVIFYLAVAAMNKFAGTSLSATGMIVGAFFVAGAAIGNSIIATINLVIDYFITLWNFIAGFAEFFANVFNDPVGSIIRLFAHLADTVLSMLSSIASAIDTIFGSKLASAVEGWRGSLKGAVEANFGEAAIKIQRIDPKAFHLERLDYGQAYDKGYNWGSSLTNGLNFDKPGLSDPWQDDMAKSMDDTAENTKGIKDAMGILDEDLKYMRDIADREYISNTSYSNVKIDMSGMITNVHNKGDLDGLVDGLATYMQERIAVAAEGVHA